jgi:hypothetical protein
MWTDLCAQTWRPVWLPAQGMGHAVSAHLAHRDMTRTSHASVELFRYSFGWSPVLRPGNSRLLVSFARLNVRCSAMRERGGVSDTGMAGSTSGMAHEGAPYAALAA